MDLSQLKEPTMDPARRQLLQVRADGDGKPTARKLVDELMGRRLELRLALFIQENARFWCWSWTSSFGCGRRQLATDGRASGCPLGRAGP
jgi:hypothetical protein